MSIPPRVEAVPRSVEFRARLAEAAKQGTFAKGGPVSPKHRKVGEAMTRPAKWKKVKTDAGWHVRLVGANGEIVLSSEVYTREQTADEALQIAERSFEPEPDAAPEPDGE